LISREVALKVTDEATRSELRFILDGLSDISLDVSCSCSLPQKSAGGEGSVFVYCAARRTKENELLSFSFNVEDISSDAWGDIVWSCEAKGAPFERAYTLRVHYDGNRLALSLSIIVTAEASNTWSRKTLNTSKQNWQIFAHALPVGKPIIKNAGAPTPREFYLSVHVPDRDQHVPESIQPPELQCRLLPFQRRAVQWMVRREGADLNKGEIVAYHAEGIPPTFFAQKGKEGDTCYMSHILGFPSNDLQALQKERELIKGGILAEEMGLGKTVELIALLCLHRRQYSPGDTVWDECHGKDVRMSGATLIITPPSILHQWQNELKMHAPDIKGV
jgi:SNF2 family DNA or RNA helicase